MCLPFVLDQYHKFHASNTGDRPFILGINGIQGIGKSTLVIRLATALSKEYGLVTLAVSIDDFCLTREDQLGLMERNPGNSLLQVRGQPGTHDMPLMKSFFHGILERRPTRVPRYNKAAYDGNGDRELESAWVSVNGPNQAKLQVVIFEGWCVGFKPLSKQGLKERRSQPSRTLQRHKLKHLERINSELEHYSFITEALDALVHLDALRTEWVYGWRIEQELSLRSRVGKGMTDEGVVEFIDAYYPAYELYLDPLRKGVLGPGHQMRVIVGTDRRALGVEIV